MGERYTPLNPLDANKNPVPSGSWMWKMRASKLDGSNIIHTAYAEAGKAESDAAWLIDKHTYDGSGDITDTDYAEGVAHFQHVYDSGLFATITAATQADPCNVTVSSITLSDGRILANGDIIYISGVVGMTELNGNFYVISGLSGAAFNLVDTSGVNINSSGYTAYSSGGEAHLPEFANYSFS